MDPSEGRHSPPDRDSGPSARSGRSGQAREYEPARDGGPTVVVQTMSESEGEMSFDELRRRVHSGFAIVRRRWWVGALAALVVGSGLGFLFLREPVEYRVSTVIRAHSSVEELLKKPELAAATNGEGERLLENHVAAMMSRRYRERLAESFSPEEALKIQTPYLETDQEPSTGMLAAVLGGLIGVSREPGREFFVITAQHPDQSVARMMVGRFSSEYRAFVQGEIAEAKNKARAILRTQEQQLANDIRAFENRRREYRQEFNLMTVEENQGMLADRLRQINQALSNVRIERARLETQLREAEADFEKNPMPFDNPVLAGYGDLQNLRLEVERLRSEQEILASQLGPNHPRRRDLEQKLRNVEEMIASSFRLAVAELKGQLSLALASERQLNEELNTAFSQSLELDRMAGDFNQLGKELAAKQTAHGNILQRIESLDIGAEMPADVMPVVEAPYAAGSTLMRRIMAFAGVGFATMVAFCGLPLIIYTLSERVSGNMDIEGEFNKEVLGVLPVYSKVKVDDRPHIVRDNVELADVETFLGLVAQMDLSSTFSCPKTLLVTSTIPGEGKSTCASNIASTYTRYGRKTVLLDCDFRRPTQQRIHAIPHDSGILEWASQGYPLNDNLLAVGGPLGLTILPDGTALIPSGGVDLQPGHVLVAWQVAELLRRLSEAYDMVIIDSPPAGVFQDACILGRYASETILIIREGRPHAAQVRKVLADLEKTQTAVLGFALNGSSLKNVHPSIGSRYGYGKYGYGKSGYGYNGRYSYHADGGGAAVKSAKRKS